MEFRHAIRNLNALFSNFPGAPDGLPTLDAFRLASHGNFPELVKPHAKCYSEACLFGILPWNPKSESHSSEFSWCSGWQKNRKCQAIIWNSVMEFQLSILPAVRVAEIFLSGGCSTRNFHPSNACLEFRHAIRNLNAFFSNFLARRMAFQLSMPSGWQVTEIFLSW